jgi:hypothetical protein
MMQTAFGVGEREGVVTPTNSHSSIWVPETPRVWTKAEIRKEIARQLVKASEDIWYFADHCYTVDTHAKNEKVSKFPWTKEYVKRLLVIAKQAEKLAVYKSRQMMVTWTMCVVVLHEVLFTPGANIGIISKKEEDAGKVLERIKTIYEYLPLHWKAAMPVPVSYRAKKGITVRWVINHPNGLPPSILQAFPSGEDQVRMETFSLIYWDEVGAAPDLDARRTYCALKPTIDGGGRLLMSGTPPISEEHFWYVLCQGQYLQGEQR